MTGFNMRGGTGVMTIVGGIQSSLLVQRTFGSQRVVFDWCSRQTDETIHLIHPSGSREWASHRLNSPMLAQVVAQHAGGQGLYRLYANRTTGPMGATFAVFAGLDPYPNLDAVTLALQAADAS
jgi:hypothetical protein